jgi:deoxyribonuclease V
MQHSWNVTPTEAVEIQRQLRSTVIVEKLTKPICTVAGCDISYNKFSDVVYAGVVVLRLPDLIEADRGTAVTKVSFPYIPGLLSFRESPAVLEAWKHLQTEPDAVMIDGHGYAHPRRFGIACHLGVLLDRPTVGCAKTVLVGKYEEPSPEVGSTSRSLIRKKSLEWCCVLNFGRLQCMSPSATASPLMMPSRSR